MKKLSLLLVLAMTAGLLSCNREDAIEPSADFTTSIENNTLAPGQGFTVYLDNVQGEFLVYFRGHNEQSTYSPDDPRRTGTNVSTELESVEIPGYPSVGEYVFTMVASSSGNWAKDYLQDVKSITITVTN
jgi:hypothetical protein